MAHEDAVWRRFGLSWPRPLFPFQVSGVERLVREPLVLLADEMGLGKTIQAVAAIRVLAAEGQIDSALVVVPSGLIVQWRRQIREWAPELRLSTVVGNVGERLRAWPVNARVYLVSYESVRSDVYSRIPTGPGNRHWGVVVIDEAQPIKTAGAETARAVKRFERPPASNRMRSSG